jgi:hypothetical protein
MQVSRLIKENIIIDSQSFRDLSPKMKEGVSDVFKLVEKETGNIIDRFENAPTDTITIVDGHASAVGSPRS